MWLELLATKAEAFVQFKKIKAEAELESDRQLKAFRSDCGGDWGVQLGFVCDILQGFRH